MEKITKNLFESILTVTQGKVEEGSVDKAHFCATHVEHSLYGQGTCISEQHAEPDENGKIDWYTVQFPTGVLRVNTDNLRVVEGKSHAHSKKMAEEEVKDEEVEVVYEANIEPTSAKSRSHIGNLSNPTVNSVEHSGKQIGLITKQSNGQYYAHHSAAKLAHAQSGTFDNKDKAHQFIRDAHAKAIKNGTLKSDGVQKEANLHPNQQTLDVHEPEKDELTANDFKMLRAGKKANMSGKKKVAEVADPENILPKNAAAPVSKSPNDKEKKFAMAKELSVNKSGVKEASTGNAFDWKNSPSQLKTKPGEKAGFDSKKIPTGTVYTRKAVKEKPVKENITQTIINHNDFVLEVTNNPTYGDYLKALQSMINTTNEDVQQELINVAEEAFNNKVDSIIIESKTRATFKAKLDELRKSGAKVLDENYMVDSGEPYVEYVVDKDGVLTQHVHVGTVNKS